MRYGIGVSSDRLMYYHETKRLLPYATRVESAIPALKPT